MKIESVLRNKTIAMGYLFFSTKKCWNKNKASQTRYKQLGEEIVLSEQITYEFILEHKSKI